MCFFIPLHCPSPLLASASLTVTRMQTTIKELRKGAQETKIELESRKQQQQQQQQ